MDWVHHIATDEAGYGPTLGPLVITATLWSAPREYPPEVWYSLLAPRITVAPLRKTRLPNDLRGSPEAIADGEKKGDQARPLWIADSKKVYSGDSGWQNLERAALAILGQIFQFPCEWKNLVRQLDPAARPWLQIIPWLAAFDRSLPLVCERGEIEHATQCLSDALAGNDFRLEQVRVQFLPAVRFNQLIERFGKKSDLLSHLTLELARQLAPEVGQAHVWSDKHGGRDRYAQHLGTVFSRDCIRVLQESREISEYDILEPQRNIRFCFRAKAESYFIVAASSIVSKYLREVAMCAFNEYWRRWKPELRPTAGYPEDARRFLEEISPLLEKLGIPPAFVRRLK
ncbi:hypothetical protein [Thermogutta sp.]|uniref:hypothetical protein n=1 Tax=Thermogutta sp. TaxID=1962930 RepID=UPI00321F7C3D